MKTIKFKISGFMAYNVHNEVEVQILDFWDTIHLVAGSKIFGFNWLANLQICLLKTQTKQIRDLITFESERGRLKRQAKE